MVILLLAIAQCGVSKSFSGLYAVSGAMQADLRLETLLLVTGLCAGLGVHLQIVTSGQHCVPLDVQHLIGLPLERKDLRIARLQRRKNGKHASISLRLCAQRLQRSVK
jgi:hypothetical protein